MLFDRYEIHIQAFVHFVYGKLFIFNPRLHKNTCNILDMNFISIKSMKYKFGKSSKLMYFRIRESLFCLFSGKGIPKLFYFQIREGRESSNIR